MDGTCGAVELGRPIAGRWSSGAGRTGRVSRHGSIAGCAVITARTVPLSMAGGNVMAVVIGNAWCTLGAAAEFWALAVLALANAIVATATAKRASFFKASSIPEDFFAFKVGNNILRISKSVNNYSASRFAPWNFLCTSRS
jgi:hypothetical protein